MTNLLLPLVGLGLYSQANNINLANNSTMLIGLFVLLQEQREIEHLRREQHHDHRDIECLKRIVCGERRECCRECDCDERCPCRDEHDRDHDHDRPQIRRRSFGLF